MAALEEAHARLLEQNRTMQDQLQARLWLLQPCKSLLQCIMCACLDLHRSAVVYAHCLAWVHPSRLDLPFHPPYWCPTCCRV